MSPFHDLSVAPILVTSPPIASTPCGITAGTEILVAGGRTIAVEHLDAARDRVVSFDAAGQDVGESLGGIGAYRLAGRMKGFRFQIRSAAYAGEIRQLVVDCDYSKKPIRLMVAATPNVTWLREPDEARPYRRAYSFDRLHAGTGTVGISPSREVASWELISAIESGWYEGPIFEVAVEQYGNYIANDFLMMGDCLEERS